MMASIESEENSEQAFALRLLFLAGRQTPYTSASGLIEQVAIYPFMKPTYQLKRKHLREVLAAANNSVITTAVVFRCMHFPHRHGVIMSLDYAIAHWTACKPWRVATKIELISQPQNGDTAQEPETTP